MINPIYKFEIERPTTNLLDPSQMVKGVTLSSTTGKTSSSSTTQVSGYMDVEEGVEYRLRNSENLTMPFLAVAFYGIDHAFISGASGGNTATAPTGAKYARISLPLSYDASEWQFAEESANFSAYVSSRVFPNFGDNVAKEYSKESGWEYFREKLNGEFTFTGPDYSYIAAQPFDHKFNFAVKISYDGGITWDPYWRGMFWKTDCKINEDDKNVVVTPSSEDVYSALVDGMDKEFDLIPLAPEIANMKMDERPMIQVYVPGQDVIGCFLSGMWWEQECTPEDDASRLENHFFFAFVKSERVVDITQTGAPEIPSVFAGYKPTIEYSTQDYVNGEYKYHFERVMGSESGSNYWQIIRVADSQVMWEYAEEDAPLPSVPPMSVTMQPVEGSGATGTITAYIHDMSVYARMICDVDSVAGQPTSEIPSDDLVENNRNYKRVISYYFPDTITFNTALVTTPTQWGIRQPGLYYAAPYSIIDKEYFPVARSAWGSVSVWFSFSDIDGRVESSARHQITLNTAYPLHSVIKVLLNQIDPTLTHEGTTAYSQFLYGVNPLSGVDLSYFITPKSNIVVSEYDQPAQKAMITLKSVFNMLRDCFRCYWFIDGNKLRIEHITFFLNGGTYGPDEPEVGIDLTAELVKRNGKAWSFNTARYTFDKSSMPTRYEFGWMDDVTKPFNGPAINILSGFVDKAKIESVNVADFTSDIDYMMLQPSEISREGFALLCGNYEEARVIEEYDLSSYETITRQLGTDGKWMSTNTNKHILVPVVEGQRLKITANATNGAQLAWFTSNATPVAGQDAPLVSGTSRFTLSKNNTAYYTAPRGANFLYVFSGTPSALGAFLPSYCASVERPAYYVPYYDDGVSLLQNGPLSFEFLQGYYIYDLPAGRYEIDGTQLYALGTKKLRVQEATFPCLKDPDLRKLVKTSLGNGEIQKLSINLSSRSAKATLMYDTE